MVHDKAAVEVQIDALCEHAAGNEDLRKERGVEGQHEPSPCLAPYQAVGQAYIGEIPNDVRVVGIGALSPKCSCLDVLEGSQVLLALRCHTALGEEATEVVDTAPEREARDVRPVEGQGESLYGIVVIDWKVPNEEGRGPQETQRHFDDTLLSRAI